MASQLLAQTIWQNSGTGDFFGSQNWSSGVPEGTAAAIIDQGTAQAASDILQQFGDLTIGQAAGSNGALEISGADIRPVKVEVGKFGTGTLTINSGYLDNSTSGNSIFIGGHDDLGGATGVGVLHMNGGYVHSADDIQLGRNGHGTLEFTGGVMRGVYTVIGKFGTGVWNQSGGVYAQTGGDFEIGDGGRPGDVGIPGPSEGFVNLTGGVIQVNAGFAMGNRIGSSQVTISGGALALTGSADQSTTLYVGRGYEWNTKEGGAHFLRIVGGDAVIAVATDLQFDPNDVFQSATLVAEITGTSHTPILVGRNAEIGNGILAVELNGYTPQSGDSWTLIQTGVDLTNTVAAVDALVAAEGPLDINGDGFEDANDVLAHQLPHSSGTVNGEFKDFITTSAPLAAGLEWELDYSDTAVVLRVIGDAAPSLVGDYNGDGIVDLADYTVWRNNLGTSIALPNEDLGVTPGEVTVEDYSVWKDNFGSSLNANELVASPAAVPEPASLATMLMGLLAVGVVAARTRVSRV